MRPLYYGVFRTPHKDKKVMEEQLAEEMQTPAGRRAIGGYTIVRSSLLTDSAFTSLEKIRVGDDKSPTVRYTVSRNDFGLLIFEKVVKGIGQNGGAMQSQFVFSITHRQ